MATGRVFTANVVLARHRGGELSEFAIGDEVPDWAADLVGDHASQGTTRSASAPAPVAPGDDTDTETETAAEAEGAETQEEEEEDSYADWTKAELKDEARAREIEGFSSMTKDELVAAIEADDAGEEA